jgi:uncharacterized membrane protein
MKNNFTAQALGGKRGGLHLLASSPSSPSHLRSLAKAVSWRAIGAVSTFALAFFITGHAGAASTIMGAEVLTKSFLYYAHERAWETGWFLKFCGSRFGSSSVNFT